MDQIDIVQRFSFHPADTEELQNQHEEVRGACLALAVTLDELLLDGHEKSLAITNLEQVMFWSNAAVARAPR